MLKVSLIGTLLFSAVNNNFNNKESSDNLLSAKDY